MRRLLIGIATLSVAAAVLTPAQAIAPAASGSNAQLTALENALTAKKKAQKNKHATKKQTLFITTPVQDVPEGDKVPLHVAVTPKTKEKVVFEEKSGGSWKEIGKKKTSSKGHAKLDWTPPNTGSYEIRAKAAKYKSAEMPVKVSAAPGPGPSPTPVPPNPQVTSMTATWPSDNPLGQDGDYDVPVTVSPAVAAGVVLQQQVSGDWTDIPGSSTVTKADGAGTALLKLNDLGDITIRAKVQNSSVATDPTTVTVSDAGDALYNVPRNLPAEPGVIVKAQKFPLTYPKMPLKNPLYNPKKPSDQPEYLIVPQIGTPAAGPPTCMTDPSVARADCKIPGEQYRVMYSDRRWVPDEQGTGSVQPGTEAATAMVLVPPNVKADAPVLAWGHPTLGQANQCSITRGVDPIPNGDIAHPGQEGPGGVDINITDMSFFLNQLLEQGYVVVMPDYMGIAVNGPTGHKKSYVLGPQEARDLYYAVKALHTPAKPSVNWPGIDGVGNSFVAAGHSQGGHAAMWAGIESKTLGPETGMDLKGVIAAAPATDINQIVNSQWDSQVNWVLGPEVIETYLDNIPKFALDHNILTKQAMDDLPDLFKDCTTQAFTATYKYFPEGIHGPGTPFMVDPQTHQADFLAWGKILGGMTPTIQQGQPNSFPKDMPLQLISGQGDDIVGSQINAAMQESFCKGGAQMNTYWTPVATGAVNATGATAPGMLQVATHLNPLNFPWANDIGAKKVISAGSLIGFAQDRIADRAVDRNCGTPQTTHTTTTPGKDVDSWYVFPKLEGTKLKPENAKFYETGGQPYLMPPSSGNASPALGTVDMSGLTPSQTGCGFQYVYKSLKYSSNPDCVQWGLWPWGKWVYPTAGPGKGWGKYPLEMAQVSSALTQNKSKVAVDVNPNRANANYQVQVQAKNGKKWKTVKKTRTKGAKDKVTVNVPKGAYRVKLPAQFRHQAYKSAKINVKR